jgi:hypothetical protein
MSDEPIERELRDAAQLLDPVPPHLVRAATGAFAWRTIDADLAELVYDSLAEPAAAVRGVAVPGVAVPGAEQPRLLTFRTSALTVELEVVGEGATRRVVGRVSPAGPADLEVRHGRGMVTVSADGLGRFAAGGLAPGPVRLRVQPVGEAPAVVTDWFSA